MGLFQKEHVAYLTDKKTNPISYLRGFYVQIFITFQLICDFGYMNSVLD